MLFCCILSVAAWSQQSRPPRVVSINGTYTNTQTLQPFLGSHNLHALAISGSVTLNSDTSLVRVIMHDVDGKSYLMYEASPMLINGYTDTLTNANEETEWMCGVVPYDLKIVVKDATCTVTGLTATQYSADNHPLRAPAQRDSIRIRQVQAKVDKINAYLQGHNKYWIAGITPMAMLSYNQKRLNDDSESLDIDLWDYYVDGIIDIGEYNQNDEWNELDSNNSSDYVKNFDWRHRHGTSWISPVKKQLTPNGTETSWCVYFAAIGVVEAMTNLYLNRTINLDLSEKSLNQIASRPSYISSIPTGLKNVGVCLEDDCPLIDDYTSNTPIPSTVVRFKISNSRPFSKRTNLNENIDSIKSCLINNGPMFAETKSAKWHAMTLVGYKVIHEGDTIVDMYENIYTDNVPVTANSDLDGRLCWIFKDSYGIGHPSDVQGYRYVVFNDYECFIVRANYEVPISVPDLSLMPDSISPSWQVNVVDRDGDGYYTWGFKQPKPAFLPDWVPDEQDGDDSDPSIGRMDRYGYLYSSCCTNDTIFITEDTDWREFHYVRNPIVLTNGATFTISAECKVVPGVTITAESGTTLNIKDKGFESVSIIGNNGSKVSLQQNSRLNISRNQNNSVSLRRTH